MKSSKLVTPSNDSLVASVVYDGDTYSVPFCSNIKFSELATNMLNNLALNSEYACIQYQGKILSLKDQRKVSSIILKDKNPVFNVTNTTPKKNTKLKKSFSGLTNTIKKENIVKVTNYLSQEIILAQLNTFYQQKNSQNLSNVIYKDQQVIKISFPSYQYAEEFVVYLKYIITINPMLSQTKVELLKNKGTNNQMEESNDTIKNLSAFSIKSSSKTLKTYKTIKPLSKPKLSKSLTRRNPITNPDEDYKICHRKLGHSCADEAFIKNYFANQIYVRNASPYISEEDKYIKESIKDRKKWINEKGFCCSVGKYSLKYKIIDNYVSKEPSENPLNHQFRTKDKRKWITEKGFC
ncbi:MAG: hypothetical protein MJ252_09255 [archaeon]|nr:hypothetical protein [archaeon]